MVKTPSAAEMEYILCIFVQKVSCLRNDWSLQNRKFGRTGGTCCVRLFCQTDLKRDGEKQIGRNLARIKKRCFLDKDLKENE